MANSPALRYTVIILALVGAYFILGKTWELTFNSGSMKMSDDLLKSLNGNLALTNTNIEARIVTQQMEFEKELTGNPAWLSQFKNRADSVSIISDSLADEIRSDVNYVSVKRATLPVAKAEKLYNDISLTRRKLLHLFKDPGILKMMDRKIPKEAESDSKENLNEWIRNYFSGSPLLSFTYLAKLNNDIRVTQSFLLDYFISLNNRRSVDDFYVARTIAPSAFVFKGDPYTADIILQSFYSSATSHILIGKLNIDTNAMVIGGYYRPTTINPVINGKPIKVEMGVGKFETVSTTIGKQNYTGAIETTLPDGTPEYFPFKGEYTVGEKCK